MVKLYDEGIYLVNGTEIVSESEAAKVQEKQQIKKKQRKAQWPVPF